MRHILEELDGHRGQAKDCGEKRIVSRQARDRGKPHDVKVLILKIVASQPQALAGVLDIDSSRKAARFVRFPGAFNGPR